MLNAVKKASLLLVPLIFITTGKAAAIQQDSEISFPTFSPMNTQLSYLGQGLNQETEKPKHPEVKKEDKKPTKKKVKVKPIVHTVSEGDTLTLIAQKHKTSWQRIYNKNTKLDSPDIIDVGEKLVIPKKSEKLKERDLPAANISPVNYANYESYTPAVQTAQAVQPVGNTAGNTYSPGYCTWYVKNRRPDIPNMLGDAISWVASAQARGMATGSTPRAGAVGQEGNHVVYVERVNKDGTVLVSEMNYQGLYVISQRTAPASNFIYIY